MIGVNIGESFKRMSRSLLTIEPYIKVRKTHPGCGKYERNGQISCTNSSLNKKE
jgi:hypothetical protein